MPNLNRVLLIGNLASDPEVRRTQSGNSVTSFGLAINRKYKSKGEQKQEVCFVNVVAWNKLGEICAKYLKKGKSVFVGGRLNQNRWEDNGKNRSRIEVVAETVQFLSPPEKD